MRRLLIALLIVAGAWAQAPATFSIVTTNDPHVNLTNGNLTAWTNVINWIQANQTAWNIQAYMLHGDIISDMVDDHDSPYPVWSRIVSDLTALKAATGIPIQIGQGNHDITYSNTGTPYGGWNPVIAPANALWSQHVSDGHYNAPYDTTRVGNNNMYQPINVVTASGTVKIGIAELGWEATNGDIASMRTFMDADTSRQYIVGTHAFLIDAHDSGTDVHPCIYGEPFCAPVSGSSDIGLNDGAGIWNGLKSMANLIYIGSGHFHQVSDAYSQLTLTGTNGNAVQASMNMNTAFSGAGQITILRFRPAAQKMDIIFWRTASDTANPAMGGGTGILTFDWTPIFDTGGSGGGSGTTLKGMSVKGLPVIR